MKRLNYFQVHKNKLPKKIKSKKPNLYCLEVMSLAMISVVKNAIIVSQPFKDIAEKLNEVALNVIKCSNAIINLTKNYNARTPNRIRRTYST